MPDQSSDLVGRVLLGELPAVVGTTPDQARVFPRESLFPHIVSVSALL